MTEIEILNNSQLGFIQNAIYTVAVVFMTFISFRLARIINEKNGNIIAKSLVTLYGIMMTFFSLQVGAYLSYYQKALSYNLSELKATGVKLSAGSDGFPKLTPELPTIIVCTVVFLIVIGTTWIKTTSNKS
jgi:hypothetical protein